MKRLLAYLFIVLGLGLNFNAYAAPDGRGQIQLSEDVVKSFMDYMVGDTGTQKSLFNKPSTFWITIDGSRSYWWYNPHGVGSNADRAQTYSDLFQVNESITKPEGHSTYSNTSEEKAKCERHHGQSCSRFAKGRIVSWDNGINPKGKAAKFSSKMSESEVRAKLAKLGFYNNDFLDTTTTPKITKKKETKKVEKKITKKTSQTQKVAQLDSHLIKPNTWIYFVSFHKTGGIAIGNFFSVSKFDASHFLNNEKSMKNYKFDKNDKLFKYKRNLAGKSKAEYFRISEKIYKLFFRQTLKKYEKAKAEGIKSYVENYKPKILKDLIDEYTEDNELKEGLLAYFNQEKPTIKPKKNTKVAKVEAKNFKCTILKGTSTGKVINFSINKKKIVDYDGYKSPIIFENNQIIMWKSSHGFKFFNKHNKSLYDGWYTTNNVETAIKYAKTLIDYYEKNTFDYSLGKCTKKIETQIAKAEPTITPKKKAKVAKTTQEEFKPETGDIDNDAPVIEIAEAITVDSQAYTLKGKVKDKSQIYLTINGRQVEVTKGTFELDRFSIDPDNAEEIKIVAIDQWNNRSEKTVKVTIDLQSSSVAKVYEGLQPNNIKVKTDNNKIAIIIGIEKYANLKNLDAKYANRDAQAFRTYATRALGIKPSNIKVLIDDKANRGNTLEAFKIWLPKKAGKGGKDIHIFFAGHGLASENGKDLYILPQDGNAKLLDDTAITRVELISLINKVNPKSVTMFFDTCYSGQTRDERMLVASLLRPIQIISEEQDTPDNFTIFSASDYDQVSGGIEEAKHGMFSYYLMKGLEGNADDNKDKKITNGELITYLKDNVSEEAFTQNREQDPMLAGDPDKILISYQ